MKQYYKKNATKLRKYRNDYCQDNRDKIKAWGQSPEGKYIEYKSNAKSRNIPFKLTFEQFKSFWKKPCWYCNNSIVTIGLDRVDNSKGYSVTNVVSCCEVDNKSKLDKSRDDYLEHCRKVVAAHIE